jgi:hypothetical protein
VWAGLTAILFGALSIWCGLSWAPAYLAAALFMASAALLLYFATRPAVEIYETHVAIGRRNIPWVDMRRLDRAGWKSPLILNITLFDDTRVLLVYPGDLDSTNSLLRHIRRSAREALIDGKSYREFWGESAPASEGRVPASPRYRLLRPEDEAEVERLYQRLKTVRHLDPDNSTDEK